MDYEAMADALLEQGKAVANEQGGSRTALDNPDNPMLAAAAAPPADPDDDNADENLVTNWEPLEARRLFWKYLRREEHRKRKFEAWQAEEERRAREWAATQAAAADAARLQAEAAAAAAHKARLSAQAAVAAAGGVAAAPAAAAAAAATAATVPAAPVAGPAAAPPAPAAAMWPLTFTQAEDRALCAAASAALRSGDANLTKVKPWEALAETAEATACAGRPRDGGAAQQRAALLVGVSGDAGEDRADMFTAALAARIAARMSSEKTATALAGSAADTLYPRRFGATPAGVRAALSSAVSAVLEQAAAQPGVTAASAARQVLRGATTDAFDVALRCIEARIAGLPPPVAKPDPAPAPLAADDTAPDAEDRGMAAPAAAAEQSQDGVGGRFGGDGPAELAGGLRPDNTGAAAGGSPLPLPIALMYVVC